MRTHFLFLFTILIFLAPLSVQAHSAMSDAHLTGHVLNAATGEHIPYVTIQVKGTTIGTVADENGHFFLTNLPVGLQTILFSCVGYRSLELPVEIIEDKTIEIKAQLDELSIIVDNVVVTATRYATKRQEASAMVNVIAPTTIHSVAAPDLSGTLDFQTGLRVEQTCGNCGKAEVRINGMEGQYAQILMDSRPVFSSLAAIYSLEQIPTGIIDRIEVIRGGGSALYGTNAIAGVVNIITKEPARNFVTISNTSQMLRTNAYDITTSLHASVLSQNKKIGAYIFAVQRNRSQYDHNQDGFSDIPRIGSTTAGGRLFFKTSDYSKLSIQYHHLSDYRRGGNKFDVEPQEADIAEQVRHNINAGGVSFDWFSSDNRHTLSLFSNVQHTARESYFGVAQDPLAFGRSIDILSVSGGQYRFSYVSGNMPADLSAGIEYTYNALHDRIIGYGRDINQHIHQYGCYIQNEWNNEYWSILLGGRLEKHNLLRNVVFTPRINVRYTPIDGVILRTSYAGGYRAPQIYDEDLHVAAVGGEVSLINLHPTLQPEYSHSVALSADLYHRFGAWQTNFTLEGFFTYLHNVFFLQETGYDAANNLILTRTNADGAWVAGMNIEGRVGYKDIVTLQIGYTFQHSEYTTPQQWSDNANIAPQKRMLRSPNNYAHMLLNITPIHDLTLSISGKATGSMIVPHLAGYIPEDEEKITQAFWDLGVRLAYDIHLYSHYVLQINGGVKNIFNQYQTDLDYGMLRDADYIYGPSLPRTYFVGLQLDL